MKARINYKSRKTIIIIAIATLLLALAIGGTIAFLKGNDETAAAMEESNIIALTGEENNSAENIQNIENISENIQNDNNQNNVENGNNVVIGENTTTQNNVNINNTITNNQNNNNNQVTNGTNENVPNQEYTQTTVQITQQPWEKTRIGWSPITVSAISASSSLGIYKADLKNEKLVYVGSDSLNELPITTVAQKGDMLTYVIKVTNLSDMDANNIKIYDSIPEGTIYAENAENPISDNGVIENGNLSWKINVAKGETKTVFFKVIVESEQYSVINNIAKVDGEDTNEVHTPIITKYKESELIIKDENGIETVEQRDAKVGETIRYKINVVNTSEYEGTTSIYDIVPEGTTLVEDSISNEGIVETTTDENGIETKKIIWNNIQIAENATTTVSFDVIVNEKKINKETLLEEDVKNVKNIAVVGNNETNEVENKVVNIKTIKTSVGTHKDGTPATEENPLRELDTITYTLTSTNYGEGTGSVVITDKLPDGTRLLSDDTTVESKIVDSDGNEYTENDLETGITITLKPEETKTITFTVSINPFKKSEELEEIDGVIIKHITNFVAKQDGTPIPGTDDLVEKEYKQVSVTKIFVDKENIDGLRPTSVLVGLFTNKDTEYSSENALETATLTDENNTHIFEKLDKYDLETSEEIIYTVKEINVDDNYKDTYAETVNGDNTTIEITNTLKYENVITSKTASKEWLDNNNQNRPQSVTLAIYDGTRKVQEQVAKPDKVDENGNWQVTFTDLQKYREDGTEIEYTFDEPTLPEGYVKVVDGNKIINKLPEIDVVKSIISVGDTKVDQDEQSQTNVTVKPGDIVEYQITVTNTGNVTLNNVTVEDILENSGKVYKDKNLTIQANTIVDYNENLTLQPNESKTYTVYYKITEKDAENVVKNPDLENEVIAKGYYDIKDENGETKQNPDPVTDRDTANVKYKHEYDISIVKEQSADASKLKPGQIINYTITIKNEGNTNLTEVDFTDVMDVEGSARKVDQITSVKVNNVNRTYAVTSDTSIRIDGILEVGDKLVITAKYTVKEVDMSEDKENTITNTATVDTKETEPEEDSVNIPTIIWKTDPKIKKEGFLKDSKGAYTVNANEKTVKYNDTIKYVLTITNQGSKPGTCKVEDKDIKGLVSKSFITAPASITVKDYKTDETKQTRTVSASSGKTTADKLYEGIDVYLPAGKSATVEFIVTVKATAGTEIKNTVGSDTVKNTVIKSANITSRSYNPKNIVIVLDLSSSMLKIAGTDKYPEDCYLEGSSMPDTALLNKSTKTRLYHAKKATKQFIDDVLKAEPETSITLVTFNYDTYAHAKTGIKQYKENGESIYWPEVKDAIDNTNVEKYMKTQTLVSATSNKTTLKNAIDNIYLTYPLLTNVVAALEETEKVVESLETSDKYKNRDIEIVFIGDGKPSYNTEACGEDGVGFYSKAQTLTNKDNLITKISNRIKGTNSSRTHIYTVEYAVAKGERDDAKATFTAMSSGDNYRYTATMEDLGDKLAEIGEAIISPPSNKTYTSNVEGDIEVSLPTSTKLKIDDKHKLILKVGSNSAIEVTAQNKIKTDTNGVVEYDADKKKLIIHASKTVAADSISLSYYYQKQ